MDGNRHAGKLYHSARPESRRLVDVFVRGVPFAIAVPFSFFTLLSNVVCQLGGSLNDILFWGLPSGIASLGVLVWLYRESAAETSFDEHRQSDICLDPRSNKVLVHLAVGGVLAALLVITDSYSLFWTVSCLYLLRFYRQECHAPPVQPLAVDESRWNTYLFCLAVIIATGVSVLVSRPSADDSLYLNIAVGALDHPDSPLFSSDTLHGIPGIYAFPSYRVQAFELFAATLAWMTGAKPVSIIHVVLPPIFAMFCICASARCFRLLLPARWGMATLILLIILLVFREQPRSYGNFGYVRMFQGKGIFLTGVIPLILACAMEFYQKPRLRSWLLLALVQICGVGLTANALYVAPIVSTFALAGCWRPSWITARRFALGVLASVCPVMMGLMVAVSIHGEGLRPPAFGKMMTIEQAPREFFSDSATMALWVLALTSTWAVVRNRSRRIWILTYALGFMLVCMNPFLDRLWAAYVTTDYLLWRILWAIPLPLFLAVLLTESLAPGNSTDSAQRRLRLCVGMGLAATLLLDTPWTDHRPTSYRMGLKVPQPSYEIARHLSETTSNEDVVLAPEHVSTWIPTFRGHPSPIVARKHYTQGIREVFAGQVDTEDIDERLLLHQFIGREVPGHERKRCAAVLRRWVGKNRISVVAARRPYPEVDAVLQDAGFLATRYLGYELFYSPEASQRHALLTDEKLLQQAASDPLPTLSHTLPDDLDALHTHLQSAVREIRNNQSSDGSWLTLHTRSRSFREVREQQDMWTPAVMIDLLNPVADSINVQSILDGAETYLERQIETNGLVRYHGPGSKIVPDSDDTSLVWRIVQPTNDHTVANVIQTLNRFRSSEGLYRTWLTPEGRRSHPAVGDDPNPVDLGINIHVYMFLAQHAPEQASNLGRLIQAKFNDRNYWPYFELAPVLSIIRQIDLAKMGVNGIFADYVVHQQSETQAVYVRMAGLLRDLCMNGRGANRPEGICRMLFRVAENDFEMVREEPLLLYHNDLTSPVSRFYWSPDLTYALWIRLYLEATCNTESTQVDSNNPPASRQESGQTSQRAVLQEPHLISLKGTK